MSRISWRRLSGWPPARQASAGRGPWNSESYSHDHFSTDDIYEQARSFSKAGQFETLALLMQAALPQVASEFRRSLRIQVRKIIVNNYAVPTAGLEDQDLIDWLAANQDWLALLEREIDSPDRLPRAVGDVVVSMDKFLEEKRKEP